jgi:hypothetical protein
VADNDFVLWNPVKSAAVYPIGLHFGNRKSQTCGYRNKSLSRLFGVSEQSRKIDIWKIPDAV